MSITLINMNYALTLYTILTFFMGASIGSFINVCFCRIPQNISVIAPRSYCPKCNTPIPWYRNIPVFSYIQLKGKCHTCKTHIPFKYVIFEICFGTIGAVTGTYLLCR